MSEPKPLPRLACLELRGGNERVAYSAELPGLAAWVCCRPMTPATRGGDLHYLSVCSQGFISRIALADVAGHGEFVSSIADRLRDVFRKHSDAWDQTEVVRELNDAFLAGAGTLEYATALVLSHYSQSGEMLFTNAGHLPPLWYHAEERQWTLMLESTPYAKEIADLPIGLISGTPYSQTAVQLGMGDLVVLYTDGITESISSGGRELTKDGLLDLARAVPFTSGVELGPALLASVESFRGVSPAEDDESLVVLERRPPNEDEPWPRS
jgi:sigma-B regulation protein RsbU (phosphoserine phosphatase)